MQSIGQQILELSHYTRNSYSDGHHSFDKLTLQKYRLSLKRS